MGNKVVIKGKLEGSKVNFRKFNIKREKNNYFLKIYNKIIKRSDK